MVEKQKMSLTSSSLIYSHNYSSIEERTNWWTMASDEQEQQQQPLTLDEAWDILCIDPHQAAHEEGRRQGREDGLQAGFHEGYELGRTTALDYGMEIGFIRGVVAALEQHQLLQQQQDVSISDVRSERILKSLASLRKALDDFPGPNEVFRERATGQFERAVMEDHTNIDNDSEKYPVVEEEEDDEDTVDSSLDVVGKMQRIRARFKLLTVQLGIPQFSLKSVMDEAASVPSPTAANESKPNEKAPEGTSEW
jgi:Essential protein Yae1, N terminal